MQTDLSYLSVEWSNFGVWHTNNHMRTHGYQRKTVKDFLGFIKSMDQKHDSDIK